ncbi:MAG: LacI family DNA-binding transcriptional regulator [Lacisediminihabitans sp.]
MSVTIEDVAAAAGVSRSTASRALSGHPAVRPSTREHVSAAAEKLNYRADPIARALRAGSSGLIGLILTNLQNPSIQEIAEVVQSLGQDAGLEVVIATTNGDPERELRAIGALTSRRVDGLIVMSSEASAPMLNSLYDDGLPLVELIRLPGAIRTPSVVYDDRAAGRLATKHLLDQGHTRIAFLGGPPETRSGRERYLGYLEAVHGRGTRSQPSDVFRGDFQTEFGVKSMTQFLDEPERATGLVIANHEALLGALQVLSQRGIAIPDQLSLIAVEDEPLLRFWHPAITVVDTMPAALGSAAMAAMNAQLHADEALETAETSPRIMPVRLIERDSTARA